MMNYQEEIIFSKISEDQFSSLISIRRWKKDVIRFLNLKQVQCLRRKRLDLYFTYTIILSLLSSIYKIIVSKVSHGWKFFLLRLYVMYVLHIGIGTYYIYLGRRFSKVKYIASLLKKLKQPSSYIVPSHFFKIIATFVPAFFPHTTHCQKKMNRLFTLTPTRLSQ